MEYEAHQACKTRAQNTRSEAAMRVRAGEGPGIIERAGWREHERGTHSRDGPEGPGHAEEVSGSSLTFSLNAFHSLVFCSNWFTRKNLANKIVN